MSVPAKAGAPRHVCVRCGHDAWHQRTSPTGQHYRCLDRDCDCVFAWQRGRPNPPGTWRLAPWQPPCVNCGHNAAAHRTQRGRHAVGGCTNDECYCASYRRRPRKGDRPPDIPPTQRVLPAIMRRYGDRCFYCPGPAETRDHYVPRSKGGSNDLDNLRPACRPCNSIKGDMMPAEWEQYRRTAEFQRRHAEWRTHIAAAPSGTQAAQPEPLPPLVKRHRELDPTPGMPRTVARAIDWSTWSILDR